MNQIPVVAYFSMEIGLEPGIPTYSGGLGMLAGDTIRAAADKDLPMVAISLLHRRGYFRQRLNDLGWQTEEPVDWPIEDYLELMPETVTVTIESRPVIVHAWRYQVQGLARRIPVYLLDTDFAPNSAYDRTLTHYLYGGDSHYRLCQEVILGIGGARMLRKLGVAAFRFHMNEGHASLLVLELITRTAEENQHESPSVDDIESVRQSCVFTTHTPVAAGHDRFPINLVYQVIGTDRVLCDREKELCFSGEFNLTYLALDNSHYINGVAKKHKQTAEHLYARYRIDSITNGVHLGTWTSPHLQKLFDKTIPGWRSDNSSLRAALAISLPDIWQAHLAAKRDLIEYVNRVANAGMHFDHFTIGFARRATLYKRPALLFTDAQRLIDIGERVGKIQIVLGGKAHPHDMQGKELIQQLFQIKKNLRDKIKIVYLEEYDMAQAKLLTSGSDLWLNTPQPPLEASGTSGMKAAVNGVPSFSVLDGWWIEGCIEGVTGWAIGGKTHEDTSPVIGQNDAEFLYQKLETTILPLYYQQNERYVDVMRHAIALNASYFNTERMLEQYVTRAYYK